MTLDIIRGPTLWRRVGGAWMWTDIDPDLGFEVEGIAMEPGERSGSRATVGSLD